MDALRATSFAKAATAAVVFAFPKRDTWTGSDPWRAGAGV